VGEERGGAEGRRVSSEEEASAEEDRDACDMDGNVAGFAVV
jgi:hypothetical protein